MIDSYCLADNTVCKPNAQKLLQHFNNCHRYCGQLLHCNNTLNAVTCQCCFTSNNSNHVIISCKCTTSVQHKPTTTFSQSKPRDLTSNARPSVICHYCKKPGHLMANCYKRLGRLAGNLSEETPVQLLSTPMRISDVASSFHRTAELKQPCPDPLF